MRILILMICIISCFQLRSQEYMVFSTINANNGLSDNRMLRIGQLNDRRMVFITEGLVNIYNGTDFSYIHFNEREAYELSNYSGFHRVYIDNNNQLWLKNYYKLFHFDMNTELFVPNVDSIFRSQEIKGQVSDIFMDNNFNFWYLNDHDDLYYHNEIEDATYLFASNISKMNGEHDYLYDIAANDSLVFLFYKSGQMICFDIESKIALYADNPFKKKNNYTVSLSVVPYKHYLYQLRNGYENKSSFLRYNILNRKWEYIFEKSWQNSINIDNKGNCWLSSSNGLWITDESLRNVTIIENFNLEGGEILKTEILHQYNDNTGGLWVGTRTKGLLYYHPDRFKFREFGLSSFGIKENELWIKCLADFDGDILVGTQRGLFRYIKGTRKPIYLDDIPKNVQCNSLYKDSKRRIWLCTSENGLYCITKDNVRHYNLSFYCQNIHETNKGDLYISTFNGFGVFDPASGIFTQVSESTKLGWIYQLMDFREEKLLGVAYGYAGLFVYDINKKVFTYPEDEENWMLRHSNLKCHDLFTDHRGLIWFGTQDGLNVYDPHNNTQESFFKSDGLVNNNIRSIIEDNLGRIWLSTSNGISCISIVKKDKDYLYSFTNYNRNDGVIDNEFLQRSVVKTSDNRLLWGGVDGFNELNLSKIDTFKPQLFAPIITKFLLFGNEIRTGEKYDGDIILNQSISATKFINLKHTQNFLGFEFSALNYMNPTQTYYKYMLEGIDATWNEVSTTNGIGHVSYTNLAPGTYNLKIFAANNNRIWSDNYSEMIIVINPSIWKTPLAYILYIILLLGVIWYMIHSYLKRNKKKIINRQKYELEQLKLAFYTNISHELKTPLTLILTPLDSIIKKTGDFSLKKQLTGIYNNAKELFRLVNQLLDFRKIEMKGETLQLSYCQVNEYLNELSYPFNEMADAKGVSISYKEDSINLNVYLDRGKLKKILNNLLSNALKFTPSGGTIEISLITELPGDESGEVFCIQVSDTGCGIRDSDLPHIFDRFFQSNRDNQSTGSGIGLHLVKEYVKMHNGTIDVQSSLGKGTTFTVKLPVKLQSDVDIESDIAINTEKQNIKILLIDDNEEFRKFLHIELSEIYEVITASNGKDGLLKARMDHPDLVISDIMMPEMSGTDYCQILKNDIRISHIPVILLTARTSEAFQVEGFKVKADAYITKPFNMEILLLRIQNLIEQQEKRKQLFKNAIVLSPDTLTTNDVDKELIKKALTQVENNIDNSFYSVEQLSKELYMDRTGLYRKLMAIVRQTPTEFIRAVRLKKAAVLLRKGKPVYEVSEGVGFGSTSYFIKCFQKEYGVKPSSYKSKEMNSIIDN